MKDVEMRREMCENMAAEALYFFLNPLSSPDTHTYISHHYSLECHQPHVDSLDTLILLKSTCVSPEWYFDIVIFDVIELLCVIIVIKTC